MWTKIQFGGHTNFGLKYCGQLIGTNNIGLSLWGLIFGHKCVDDGLANKLCNRTNKKKLILATKPNIISFLKTGTLTLSSSYHPELEILTSFNSNISAPTPLLIE